MLKKLLNFIGLFASFSTLFCCAIPALFVVLGFGAAFVGVMNVFPQMIWISEHRTGVFIFAGTMLALNGLIRHSTRKLSCPANPGSREACTTGRRWADRVYFGSLALYTTGGLFAFILPYLNS